jgi:histidinol-phosphate phosphatase family protein
MFPAIFLDRDGVLIENRADYVRDWSQVNVIPRAIRALSRPHLKKYKVVVVTNQSAVGQGLLTLETAVEINHRLAGLIRGQGGQLAGIYMCPHRQEDGCSCRKPNPGLLLQAAAELDIDLARSWMIGDAWSDVLAGQAAGVRHAIILKTGRGSEQLDLPCPENIRSHLVMTDLAAALEEILSLDAVRP